MVIMAIMAIIAIIALGYPSACLSSTSLLHLFIMLHRLPIIRLLRIIMEVITHRVIGFGSRDIGTTDRLLMAGKGRGSRVIGNGEIDSPAISKGKK